MCSSETKPQPTIPTRIFFIVDSLPCPRGLLFRLGIKLHQAILIKELKRLAVFHDVKALLPRTAASGQDTAVAAAIVDTPCAFRELPLLGAGEHRQRA